jgi:WD40 repeat protein
MPLHGRSLGMLALLIAAAGAEPLRKDLHGDPLPQGAIARLGTVRLRHAGAVLALACSPDGKTVASAGAGGVIRLWDLADGREVRHFVGHTDKVTSLAFSPDGLEVASADNDGFLRLWNVATAKEKSSIHHSSPADKGLAWSPDGQLLLTGFGKEVWLWSPSDNTETQWRERPEKDAVARVAFAPDGKSVAVAVWDSRIGRILRFDPDSSKELPSLQGHGIARVTCMLFSPDSRVLVSGDSEREICAWDLASGKRLWREDQTGSVEGVCFSADGGTLLSAGKTGEVCFRDPRTGKVTRRITSKQSGLTTLALTPDGRTFVTGYASGAVWVWNVATGEPRLGQGVCGEVLAVNFSPDGKEVLSFTQDQALHRWEASTGRQLHERALDMSLPFTAAFSPDCSLLAGAGDESPVGIWETATGKRLHQLDSGSTGRSGLAFSADGRTLASGAENSFIRLWDPGTGRQLQEFDRPVLTAPPLLTFFSDGKTLASVSKYDLILVCDVKTGTVLHRLRVRTDHVSALAVSPDGRYLAAAGWADLQVWDLSSDNKPWRQRCLSFPNRLAWTRDGRTLIAGDRAGSLVLWEAATGSRRLTWPSGQGRITTLAVADDRRRLAVGLRDSTTLVVDLLRLVGPLPLGTAQQELPALWDALASENTETSWQAICTLGAAPEKALPLLKEQLSPVQEGPRQRFGKLLAQLDDDSFDVRERATEELTQIVDEVGQLLEEELQKDHSAEVRRRITLVLEKRGNNSLPPGNRRILRALEALELLHTPEARTLLEKLAGGAPDALQTREAKAALARWK